VLAVKAREVVEVLLRSFLTSELGRGEWLASRPAQCTAGEPGHPWSGHWKRAKFLPGDDNRITIPQLASSYPRHCHVDLCCHLLVQADDGTIHRQSYFIALLKMLHLAEF